MSLLVAFLFVLLGLVGSRWSRTETLSQVVTKVLVNFVYPCLIVSSILGGYSKQQVVMLWYLPVGAFLLMLVGYLFFRFSHRKRADEFRVWATKGVLSTAGNYVFLPYPLALALWGDQAGHAVVLSALGSDIGLWFLGASFFARGLRAQLMGLLKPPVLTLTVCVIAVLVNFRLDGTYVGAWIIDVSGFIGKAAVPSAMFILGHQLGLVRISFRDLRELGDILSIRHLAVPMLAFVCLCFLDQPLEVRRVLLLIAGMPSAIGAVFLARFFGGDPQIAAKGVFWSHALALLTCPLYLGLFDLMI